MTPYQRGNRDGLLSFAKWCDERAAEEQSAVDLWDRSTHKLAGRLAENRSFSRTAYREAAQHARRAAEALPDDPEDQDTPAPLVEPPVLADALRFQPVLNDGTGASAQRAVDALVRAGWSGSYVNDGSTWGLRTIGDALPRRVPIGSRVSMRVDGRLWVVP